MTGPVMGVKGRLAGMLSEVPTMAEDYSRHVILAKMRDDGFELSLYQAGTIPLMCWQVIDKAAAQAGALQCLAAAVHYFDPSEPARRFAAEVAVLLPSEFFTLDIRSRFVGWINAMVEPE